MISNFSFYRSPSRIETTSRTDNLDFKNTTATSADAGNGLEKSKSDSKINQVIIKFQL